MVAVAIRKALPDANVSVVNAGISGHSTVDALKRLDHDVLAHRPQLVTVMFALNDMVRVPINAYRANLKKIIAKCRGAGAEVMLCTPNGVIATPGRSVEKLAEYCDALRAVARQAMVRKVGARGLRMILEELMLDLMYHLPSQKKVKEFEVTREMVEKRNVSLTMMEKAG